MTKKLDGIAIRVKEDTEVGDVVDVAGMPVRVVSNVQAEEAGAVMCAPADSDGQSGFTDNVHTICHDCKAPIIHRPNAPAKPIKLCMACAIQRMEGGNA